MCYARSCILFVYLLLAQWAPAQNKYPHIAAMLDNDQVVKAEDEMEEVFKSDSTSFDYFFLTGRLQKARCNYASAEACLKKCIRMDSLFLPSYGVLADVKCRQGQYAEARRLVDHALQTEPDNIKFINEKAIIHYEQGEYAQAYECMEKLLLAVPTDADFLYNAGTTLNQLKRYREAIDHFDKALLLHPADAKTYYDRGVAFYKLDRPHQAYIDFKNVLKYNPGIEEDYFRPKYYLTYDYLSRICTMTGKPLRSWIYAIKANHYRKKEI